MFSCTIVDLWFYGLTGYFYIFAILTRGVAGLIPLSVTHVAPHVSDTCFGVLRKDGKYVNVPTD
jgi:hypothetical protein